MRLSLEQRELVEQSASRHVSEPTIYQDGFVVGRCVDDRRCWVGMRIARVEEDRVWWTDWAQGRSRKVVVAQMRGNG